MTLEHGRGNADVRNGQLDERCLEKDPCRRKHPMLQPVMHTNDLTS